MIYAALCSSVQEIMKIMFYIEYENLLIHASSFARHKASVEGGIITGGNGWCFFFVIHVRNMKGHYVGKLQSRTTTLC